MKAFAILGLLIFSFIGQAGTERCDLSTNDLAVNQINWQMDNAQINGEDHLVGLVRLQRERMGTVRTCLITDRTSGLGPQDLKAAKIFINDELDTEVEDLNEAIRISLDHDRIGMATELTMERDLLILEAKNLLAKIETLLRG